MGCNPTRNYYIHCSPTDPPRPSEKCGEWGYWEQSVRHAGVEDQRMRDPPEEFSVHLGSHPRIRFWGQLTYLGQEFGYYVPTYHSLSGLSFLLRLIERPEIMKMPSPR
jgi:hypothetical protein